MISFIIFRREFVILIKLWKFVDSYLKIIQIIFVYSRSFLEYANLTNLLRRQNTVTGWKVKVFAIFC